jgi:uncharacterized protein YbbC (DUF1343 family)
VICHAASVTSAYSHIIDVLGKHPDCKLGAIFGPQHGLYGQTQDNMIEWEGAVDPVLKVPVYSLYGKVRKPTTQMLDNIDAIVFDIQDVGARPYTYIWTLKLVMEACSELHIPVWVLDRPNPIGAVTLDGPMMSSEFFSFVGGAEIPLCHRLTMGEMARILQNKYFPSCDLNVVWMEGWWRNSLWPETELPWVLPSPNMPTVDTAIVYPGQVLLEATNISEGRGTTRPFELCGAPYLDFQEFKKKLYACKLSGCTFRDHGFIPTFQKWQGKYCDGIQIHVTNPRCFSPVLTAVAIVNSMMLTSDGEFSFKNPPYEYEHIKMPFDILAGSEELRVMISESMDLEDISAVWKKSYTPFMELFDDIAYYGEER